MSRLSISLFMVFFPILSFSQTDTSTKYMYYGKDLMENPQKKELKNNLHIILNSAHSEQSKTYDKITDECSTDTLPCTSPISYSYRRARELLFGQIYLEETNGQYWVEDFYCDDVLTNSDFPKSGKLGPDNIPSETVMNTEHSWPQSLFTNNFPKDIQKTDLHALFPVRSKLNSIRGNRPYGYVVEAKAKTCQSAKFGSSSEGHSVFEPADANKGNIARALFYFSTRYSTKIDSAQENVLREWHNLDPVDNNEIERHEEIFNVQKIRNPYIDHPEWVNNVSDF